MEKPTWKKIESTSSKPCPRWGHASCVVGDEVLFFGGYADSNYMNDLWTYHATQKSWQQVITTGQKPSLRSNCTINYDPSSNQVIVFGGGGPNKQRFNAVSVLNWETKVWRQIVPKENQASPWQRTYHVAELTYPYLVIFGGEGMTDLDDLWVFNFLSERWTEIKFDKDAVRPCARRFHSSCIIDNEFFIVAGCHGKYRCLGDVYSLDLKPLLAGEPLKELRWVERKLKGAASFLSRWGHSSAVFDDKIYVFAGRFSSDLNDVLVIDAKTNTMKGLRMGGGVSELPKPRRRHCASFVGSCMIIFGGFNGQYFNDLHYINVFELSSKPEVNHQQSPFAFFNNHHLADRTIESSDGVSVAVHQGLLAPIFSSEEGLQTYLDTIDEKYNHKELLAHLECLYRGYGKTQDPILSELGVKLPESLNRRWLLNRLLEFEPNERNMLAIAHQVNEKTTEHVVSLKQTDFEKFLENRRSLWYMDSILKVNNSELVVSGLQLSLLSPYFRALFSGNFQRQATLPFSHISPIVVEIILNAMMIGVIVVPQDYSVEGWMELVTLTDYLCLSTLRSACEVQLCSKVSQSNCQKMEQFAENLDLSNLAMHCANLRLRSQSKGQERRTRWTESLTNMMRLQLAHQSWSSEHCKNFGKGQFEKCPEEKENNRECSNI